MSFSPYPHPAGADGTGIILTNVNYSPYGVPDTAITGFAFTGEQRDSDGLQYHRARYYSPALSSWTSLDPFEGIHDRPMSLNGYGWVEGNSINATDSTGLCLDLCNKSGLTNSLKYIVGCDTCPDAKNLKFEYQYLSFPAQHSNDYAGYGNPMENPDPLEQELARTALLVALQETLKVGNDDAALTLYSFFYGNGTTLQSTDGYYPIEKMLLELPVLRQDIADIIGESTFLTLSNKPEWGEKLNNSCTVWRGYSAWRRVGIAPQIPTVKNIYPHVEPQLAPGTKGFKLLYSDFTYPYRNEFDWFIALNAFEYSISFNIAYNEFSNSADIAYRIYMEDLYAWYPGLSILDTIMGQIDIRGLGQPYYIKSLSAIKEFMIPNLSTMGAENNRYAVPPPESVWGK